MPETAHQLVGDQQRSRRLDQFDTVIGNQQNTKLSDAYFKLLKQLPTITNTAQQSQAIQQFMDSPLNKDKNGNQVMYVYKPGEIVHGSPYPSYTDPKVTAQINKLDAGAKLDDVMAQLDPQKLTEVIKRDRNMESIGQQDADAHTLTSQTGANRLQAEISGKIGGGKSGGNLSANEIAQATGKLAGAQSKVQDLQRALNIELSIDTKTPGFNQANHDLNVNNIRAGLEKANAEIVDAQAVLSYAKEHQNTSGINAPKTGGGSAGAKGFAPMGSGIKPPPTLVGANPQTPKVTSTMRPPAQAAGGGNPPPGFNPIKSITNPAVQKYGLSYNPSTNTYWSSKLGKVITLGK